MATIDVTTYGATGNGSADDTTAIQSAANAAGNTDTLYFPTPSSFYKITNGITVKSSILGQGSSLPKIMFGVTPSGDWPSSVFKFVNVTDSNTKTVRGMYIDGGAPDATSGEHQAGVHIGGSKNIVVEYCKIKNCRGDGVYVGGGGLSSGRSSNILIQNNIMEGHRRCGIAVINVIGCTITGNSIAKYNSFVNAIDIEPNPNGSDYVLTVLVDNNKLYQDPAFSRSLVTLYHSTTWPVSSIGYQGKDITISNNHCQLQSGISIVKITDPGVWQNVIQTGNILDFTFTVPYPDPIPPGSTTLTESGLINCVFGLSGTPQVTGASPLTLSGTLSLAFTPSGDFSAEGLTIDRFGRPILKCSRDNIRNALWEVIAYKRAGVGQELVARRLNVYVCDVHRSDTVPELLSGEEAGYDVLI